ncbi:Hypothetical predicted protein [Pelobates cultripes]|uniref:Uncharacterized protein n=1 Tax=Pelobates cultripes TaxID=61616 RepID=A0AAD1W2Y7_PELCU|nr:Hypothetical predicted protein [Pelobates cultripes]
MADTPDTQAPDTEQVAMSLQSTFERLLHNVDRLFTNFWAKLEARAMETPRQNQEHSKEKREVSGPPQGKLPHQMPDTAQTDQTRPKATRGILPRYRLLRIHRRWRQRYSKSTSRPFHQRDLAWTQRARTSNPHLTAARGRTCRAFNDQSRGNSTGALMMECGRRRGRHGTTVRALETARPRRTQRATQQQPQSLGPEVTRQDTGINNEKDSPPKPPSGRVDGH